MLILFMFGILEELDIYPKSSNTIFKEIIKSLQIEHDFTKLISHFILLYKEEPSLMSLDKKTRQVFKAQAHKLKPVVMIGNKGLTENVNFEIDQALEDHELIKIRISCADRKLKQEMFQEICRKAKAEVVLFIGGIGVIYRKRAEGS